MENEIWKYYKTSHKARKDKAVYEVSNQGRVKINGKIVSLDNSGKYICCKGFCVHRVVAKLFVPNPENKPFVDHINTNRYDNRAVNLRWCTAKENNNNPLTKQHFKEAQKRRYKDPEQHKKTKEAMQGVNQGENNPAFGHKWMSNGIDRAYPKQEEIEYYLSIGYHFGMK